MKRPGRIMSVLAAAVCLAATAFPAPAGAASPAAQTDPLQLDVAAGFDGYYQDETWTPVTVTASNDGDDVSGELRVQVVALTGTRASYTRSIDLPHGSRKQVTFYATDLSMLSQGLQVDLVERGRVLTSQRVNVAQVRPSTLLIGVWSNSPQALADLAQVTPSSGETRVARLTAEDLPENPLGWQALDVLAISDVDSGQLTAAQREAMRDWVSSGGRLLIVGGISYQRTLAGLDAVMPVRAESSDRTALTPLAALADPDADALSSIEAPVAVGALAEGAQVLVANGDIPLLVTRRLGDGRVHFLAADPSLAPLAGWAGLPGLWQTILSSGEPRPSWAYGFSDPSYAREAVAAIPGVRLPSLLQLCGFLALYVVLIGPVNYIVLTRLKRRELAWITIPALILLFSGVAYVTGFQLRGSRAILHRLAFVHAPRDTEVQQVDALVGVWSPRRARYDIELSPGFLARPLSRDFGGGLAVVSEVRLEQGEQATLRDVRVDVGAVQPFVVTGTLEDAVPIAGALTLSPEGSVVRANGEIENLTDAPLTDGVLAIGGSVIELGDLTSGETIAVDEVVIGGQASRAMGSALDPYPPGSYYPEWGNPMIDAVSGGDCWGQPTVSRRCNLFMSLLSGTPASRGATAFFWSEAAPFGTEVVDGSATYSDVTLYAVDLDTQLEPAAQGRIEVPPGLTSWRVLDDPYGYVTPYDMYLFAGEGYTFRYELLPLVGEMEIESFVIHLTSDANSGQPPNVQIRNVQSGHWEAQRQAGFGDTAIEEVDRYVDEAGGVEIRLFGPEGDIGGQTVQLDISYTGVVTTEE